MMEIAIIGSDIQEVRSPPHPTAVLALLQNYRSIAQFAGPSLQRASPVLTMGGLCLSTVFSST